MKKLSALLLLCFAVLFSNAQQTDTTTRTKVGDLSPNFSFNLSKDKVASLSDYKGKIVVLDFLPPGARLVAWNCHGFKKKYGRNITPTPSLPYLLSTVKKTGIKYYPSSKKTSSPSQWCLTWAGQYSNCTLLNLFHV
jgi:hypothetical protein